MPVVLLAFTVTGTSQSLQALLGVVDSWAPLPHFSTEALLLSVLFLGFM